MALKSGRHVAAAVAIAAGIVAVGTASPALAKIKRHAPVRVATAATAAVTGLAASHDMRREGNRLCFADHYHYGSSSGARSKQAAQAEAVASWAGFVDFEYGGSWAGFARASGKSMTCSQSGGGWGCEMSARPCR